MGRPTILLLGDQLFPGQEARLRSGRVLMVEDAGLTSTVRHHRQKLVLVLSAMRHHAAALTASGVDVTYLRLDRAGARSLEEEIDRQSDHGQILTWEPHDRSFAERLRNWAGPRLTTWISPGFLTPAASFESYRKRANRLTMGDFYARRRVEAGLLLEADGKPIGGRWSLDEENRRPLPRHVDPPRPLSFPPDKVTEEVIRMVADRFPEHPGELEGFNWPVTRADALVALEDFMENRFDLFGPYEDALPQRSPVVYHSQLSPLLNIGLLTPDEVIRRALQRHAERPVPLSSLEGFVRQVFGWREWVKLIDTEYARRGTEFGGTGTRALAPAWWDGTTGLPPLDLAIDRARRTGWIHHIERLMVVGNLMNLCDVRATDAYRWFMEMCVDSAEWVMTPNVYGMAMHADGGMFATKPYVCGSAYIRRMGDYPRGPWCDIWDGLFWRYVARNEASLASNHRTLMMVRGLARLHLPRRDRLFAAAEQFIDEVTMPGPGG